MPMWLQIPAIPPFFVPSGTKGLLARFLIMQRKKFKQEMAMSDLRGYETPEGETGNTGKIVGVQETAMSGLRGYEMPKVETGNTGKIVGAPETTIGEMRGFEPSEGETGNTGKIVAAVIVALMISTVGAYTYETGMWNSQPKQVMASLVPPSTNLPPSVAPTQHTVVPQLPPVENAPAEISPQATTVPPVGTARTHVLARASRHTPTVQPSENISDQTAPASVPPPVSVPEQPAPLNTNIVAPAIAPSLDAPTQNVPEQPAQAAPVQPAPQP